MDTLERMNTVIRKIAESEGGAASELVRLSFNALAAKDWEPQARATFLEEASPEQMVRKLSRAACAFGAYVQGDLVGLLLMPRPAVLEMLFVHPEGVGAARPHSGQVGWCPQFAPVAQPHR